MSALKTRNAPNSKDGRPILTSNMKCPLKSKPLLPIYNNKVRIKISIIFRLE